MQLNTAIPGCSTVRFWGCSIALGMSADKKHDLRYFDVIIIHLHRTDNVVELEEEPIELVAVQVYCPA